ncbi:hypothetical protein FAVG1_06854 [Fusarium avenaceum]|nr:hypothetical protein FAVG1_06854 [Fusarium avenaceum]
MSSLSNPDAQKANVSGKQENHLVSLEHYGLHHLQQPSTEQKLTPLDMNLPRLYGIRLILCYPLASSVDKLQIYEHLKEGLAHTIVSIPWITGIIGPEIGQDPKLRKVQILSSPSGLAFPYKDLTETLPSYAELKERAFPLSEFSTAHLGPIDVMPHGDHQPVFAAQANFVNGGLLLSVGVHHSACDASALEAIISTWSENTAVVSGSSHGFSRFDVPSNDRSPLMQGELASGTDISAFPEYVLRPTPNSAHGDFGGMPSFEMPPLSSHLFHFSPEALAKLKEDAVAFSSHDALCAFIWQRMTLARIRSGVFTDPPSETETTRLGFAVNIRSRVSPPLPPSYMGNGSMACVTRRMEVASLASSDGLRQAAAAMRRSLNEFNSPSRITSTIGLLTSRPDPTDFKLDFHAFLGPDVVESSWADLDPYRLRWGGAIGSLDAVRMPGEGADGSVMIMPRLKDGSLDVIVSLATAAMEKLLDDKEFTAVVQS